MCRCQDGALTEWEERELLYQPDAHGFRTVNYGEMWHYIELDPVELEKHRSDQLAFVGRQGHQSIIELEQLSLIHFYSIFEAISRQIEYENQAAERHRQEMGMT